MAPPLQDQFIDDDEEEEVCPLCVEELDLTDKNFRPCPCGYQVAPLLGPLSGVRVTHCLIDMSILLQQHQNDDEWPLSCLQTTL
jgi:hypothetical protein